MDIGSKIKSSRIAADLTQESLAEKLNTTRQTVSSWENNRSYPDIISLVEMSNIFGTSLDEFIKGDRKMLRQLDNDTNLSKYNSKMKKLIEISLLLIVWSLCLLAIYLNRYAVDILHESAILYYILPVTFLTLSISMGSDKTWGKFKYNMPFLFGFAHYLVFAFHYSLSSSNDMDTLHFILKSINSGFPNFLLIFGVSYFGLFIGYIFTKKQKTGR